MRDIIAIGVLLGLLFACAHIGANKSERAHRALDAQYDRCIHTYGPGPALHRCLAGQNRREK